MPNPFDTINPPPAGAAPPQAETPQTNVFDSINPPKPAGPPNLRSMVHQNLGSELGDVRDFLPAAGGMAAGIPGAAAGAFAKQAMSPEPDLGTAGVDTLLQGVIPKGIEAGFSRGLKGGAANLISKLPQSIIDRLPGVVKAKLTGQLTDAAVPASRSVAARESADLVSKFAKPSTGSFDSAGLFDELSGPKAAQYKMQYGEGGYNTLKELANSANKAGVGKESDSLFSWKEGRKLAITGVGLHLLGIPAPLTTGVVLGADAMKKILGDPRLGQLILQSMKTGSKAPESSLLLKSALAGLRGTTVYLQNADGQKDSATIQIDPKSGEPQLQYSQPGANR